MISIEFHCTSNGQKYYRVMQGGEEIFCGLKGECRRFIEIHNEKARRREPNKKPRPSTRAENPKKIRRR